MPMRENEYVHEISIPSNVDPVAVFNIPFLNSAINDQEKGAIITRECYSYELDARSENERYKASVKNEAT